MKKRYGWGWIDGEGADAKNKWIQISELNLRGHLDEEMAVIMCRDFDKVLKEHPEWIRQKEADADLIVNALNKII